MAALGILLGAALLYAWALTRVPRSWPAHRTVLALAGLLALAAALGPLDGAADGQLAAHMVQHVLIGTVAPALIAASAPVRLALATLAPPQRRRLGDALHARAVRVLALPAVAIPATCAVLVVGHLPAVVQATLEHPLLHAVEHAALFWTALIAWIAVLGLDPVPAAPGPIGLLLALAPWMIAMAAVGSDYASADHVLISAYGHGPAALADQRSAGVLMWLAGAVTVAPVSVAGSLHGMWREELRQRRREQAESVR